jgi:Arc/MetJ family transcription regulator
MRTNIVLNDFLLESAMRLSGAKTKREAVEMALSEYVEKRERKNLFDLFGQGLIADDYDYKALREGRDK